jgi:sugar lactone lactonase YvrE
MPQNLSKLLLLLSSQLGLGGLIFATLFIVVVVITTTAVVMITPAKGQTDEFNVYKFDNNGNFILGWGSRGAGPNQFYHAHGIAIDSSGNVYVSDQGNFQSQIPHPDAIPHISKFTSDGKFITKWGSENINSNNNSNNNTTTGAATATAGGTLLDKPWGVAVDSSGNILVTDKGRNMAFKFTRDGKYLQTLVQTGPADGQLQHPHGIAFDSSGNFYIADQVHGNVQKFSPDGKFLLKFGSEGRGDGPFFHRPHGVAVDSSGNIFVADSGNHRIEKFSPNGTLIKSWGHFKDPHDIKIDASGNVYLINTTYDDVAGAANPTD